MGRLMESNPRMSEPQSDALTTSPQPLYKFIIAVYERVPHTWQAVERTHTKGFETSILPLNYAPKWWRGRIRTAEP